MLIFIMAYAAGIETFAWTKVDVERHVNGRNVKFPHLCCWLHIWFHFARISVSWEVL